MSTIKHRDHLLWHLAKELEQFERTHPSVGIGVIEVTLYEGPQIVCQTSLAACLDYLVNDVFRTEIDDWRDADRISVGIM